MVGVEPSGFVPDGGGGEALPRSRKKRLIPLCGIFAASKLTFPWKANFDFLQEHQPLNHIFYFSMLDIHSHILPGIDDGPATIDESLRLAVLYEQCGFSRVVATPHWIHGTAWMPESNDIRDRTDLLNAALQNKEIGIRVFSGMEIAMDAEIPALLSRGQLLTLAESPYLLIETPFQRLPFNWEHLLFTIKSKGYRIVLAHPERCAQIIDNPGIADAINAAGIYFQCNYDSFLGNYGGKTSETIWQFLKKGYIHFLATDSHDTVNRYPGNVEKTIRILEKKIHADTLNLIARINPDRLINGLSIDIPAPADISFLKKEKGKKRWRLF